MTDIAIKEDGKDQLREYLSPTVTMTFEQPFSDEIVITLTCAPATQFDNSPFSHLNMTSQFRLSRFYAESWKGEYTLDGQRILPSKNEWEIDMKSIATSLLEKAQRDPVGFFRNDD